MEGDVGGSGSGCACGGGGETHKAVYIIYRYPRDTVLEAVETVEVCTKSKIAYMIKALTARAPPHPPRTCDVWATRDGSRSRSANGTLTTLELVANRPHAASSGVPHI